MARMRAPARCSWESTSIRAPAIGWPSGPTRRPRTRSRRCLNEVVTVRWRRPVKRAASLAGVPLRSPRSAGGATIVLATGPKSGVRVAGGVLELGGHGMDAEREAAGVDAHLRRDGAAARHRPQELVRVGVGGAGV